MVEREGSADMKLYFTEKGTGFPFILLHGNGEDGSVFRHQMKYFSKEYRVIAPDTRGHGRSPRGEEPFTIRQFAEDLKEFMDEQQIERANILGFSDGGNIALVFALNYPERVNCLILNGANLNGKGVKPSVQIPIIAGYYFASFCAKWSKKAKRNAEMLGLMVNDPDIRPEELTENQDPEFLRIPKLVIAGTKDMIKDEHTRLIYASLSNAQIAVIPGDHFIASKNPEQFNAAVEVFLREYQETKGN